MEQKINTITINGIEYVEKSKVNQMQNSSYDYVIVRTYSAGVFAGYLKKREGKEVTLTNAKCLWYWEGAFTLLEIAMQGVSKPDKCKFSMCANEVLLTETIELLPTTQKAKDCLESIPAFKN